MYVGLFWAVYYVDRSFYADMEMTETISTSLALVIVGLIWSSFIVGALIGCFLGREK